MPLFLFKDIEEKSCAAAKQQFGIKEDAIVLDNDLLPRLSSAKSPFVILGHTEEVIYDYALWQSKKQTLGGLTAEEMAERFARIIPKEQRGQLKDLYLVACEAGLNDSAEKPCYARELAYKLYRQGFTEVAVHTVTSPPLKDTPHYAGMRVELVTKIGIEGQLDGIQLGHARAFMTTPDYEATSERVSAMESELRGIKAHTLEAIKRRSELNRQILSANGQLHTESREHLIMDVADLKTELDRPENTFRAHPSLKDIEAKPKQLQLERGYVKQQKMNREIKPLVSQKMQDEVYSPLVEKARADSRLMAVLAELSELQRRYRNDKKYLDNIDSLVALMKDKQHWQQALFEKMDTYHALSVLEKWKKKRSTSSFYDLMLHLVREYRLKRTDIDSSLEQTIKKAVPDLALEQVIFNKNKDKLAVTLVSRVGDKVSLIEFSLKKKEQGKLSEALIRKKIEKGEKREEESKKTYAVKAQPSSDWEDEPLIPKPVRPLPALGHYYQYANRHHFWPATIKKGQFVTLHGDALKQAILTDFKQQIEACDTDRSLKDCGVRLRKTSEFSVLSMAQDPLTYFFSWLPWVKTSSEKAFDQMLSEQTYSLSTLKKDQ